MARKSIEQRLAQLEAQKKTLQARLGKQARAADTRRKVLLGAFLLSRLESGKDGFSTKLREWLSAELPGFLVRDADKALFADLIGKSATPVGVIAEPVPNPALGAIAQAQPATEAPADEPVA
jgi:hypothetical protein